MLVEFEFCGHIDSETVEVAQQIALDSKTESEAWEDVDKLKCNDKFCRGWCERCATAEKICMVACFVESGEE